MKVANRVNISDANSLYINKTLSSLEKQHQSGLTIIQQINEITDCVRENIITINKNTNINLILVSINEQIFNELCENRSDRIKVIKGTIEEAKLHINYSHVLIIDDSLKVLIENAKDIEFKEDELYLINLTNNESIDAKIYRNFLAQNNLSDKEIDSYVVDKLIRETNCIIPTRLIFQHSHSNIFSFRFNIWMSNLMSILNFEGEIKLFKNIIVDGAIERGMTSNYNEILSRLKYIDNRITKRFDERISSILFYFNKMFTSQLKNLIDRGNISKSEVINRMKNLGIENVYHSVLNKGEARKLVLAYCFPPFNDTSGNVMAKRIFESGSIVDVISNDMSKIRNKDNKLINIMSHLLDSQIVLNGPQAFSSWRSIEEYTEGAYQKYLLYENKYDEIYSRVMFPHSHFAAFEIKKHNKNIRWIAEFSDPLYTDVSSNLRYAPIEDDDYVEMIKEYTGEKYSELIDDNSFNVCEVLPFLYADELIFTNKYQMDYMLERFDDELQSLIRRKAVIKQHPTLPQDMYKLVKSFYKVKNDEINIAYFGNFYDTRGFRQIELVAKELYDNNINNFRIHVFTNLNAKTSRIYNGSDFKEYIEINNYAPYFEFLNLTNLMDVLLIFDAETKGIKSVNPYVPSKLSDYRGSTSKIWAFTEKDSILDLTNEENIFINEQKDYHKYNHVFRRIAEEISKPLYNVNNIKCID